MNRRLRNEKTAWDINPRHLEILREHLPLFLEHAQAILTNPSLRDSPVACAAIGGTYIGGITDITLGGLLAAWEQGLLRCPCPRCGDTLYIHILVGSPLSGGHALRGVCTACRQAVSGHLPEDPSFSEVLIPAIRFLRGCTPRCPEPESLEQVPRSLDS